jgi:hypothetical protein
MDCLWRRCNDQKSDLTHAYEPNDLGQRQALLHLRQAHVTAYDAFLHSLPEAPVAVGVGAVATAASELARGSAKRPSLLVASVPAASSREVVRVPSESDNSLAALSDSRANGLRTSEAERSRLRRLRAPPEAREMEAQRSKKRREKMTPAQRHADAERRRRKQKRIEEAERSKQRRKQAPHELKEKETRRSRDRRLQASGEQREREAHRSRERRRKATEDQKARERERCRRRYEAKKLSILQRRSASVASDSVDDDRGGDDRGNGTNANANASANAALQSLYASLSEPQA